MERFLLALVATGIALFALVKPVHIDDTVVLHVAANILRDPLHPFAGEFFWLEEPQPLAKVTTNPPLVSYWLAPWIALAGYREWVLHLSFAPFVALLMWGMHRLATRWLGAEWAWWAVGWLMLSPAVLPGMNLMRDVPALALLVGGLACWVEGVEHRGARWLAAGALLVGLAGLAKYTALIGVLLGALYTLQRRAYGALGWLTLALVPIAGWSALNLWADGEVHLVYLWQERRGSAPLGAKLLPGVVGLGASTLLWLGVRRRFKAALGDGWRWKVALLVLAAAGVVGWYHLQFAGQPMYLQSLLWLVAGVIVLGLAVGVGSLRNALTPSPSPTGWELKGVGFFSGHPPIPKRKSHRPMGYNPHHEHTSDGSTQTTATILPHHPHQPPTPHPTPSQNPRPLERRHHPHRHLRTNHRRHLRRAAAPTIPKHSPTTPPRVLQRRRAQVRRPTP
jgi:4-amino-4-deoxy-L-arabinose transferase-like glycosyltransferase